MLFIRFIHFLTGYVVFAAAGGFPERFVNLCADMGIPVWDVRPQDGVLLGRTTVPAYRRLRIAAKRAGMRLRVRERRGLPFFLHRNRKRFGVPLGAAVCFMILVLLSSRLWVIEIEGNDMLTSDTVREALREVGVREGMRPDAIDASAAERELLRLMPGVDWIALNVDGSVLHVALREDAVPDTNEPQKPCHIVAARDGYLLRLEPYEGQAIAKINTAVQQGELLVSGAKEHKGGVTLHHAAGYAEAQTTRTLHAELPDRTYAQPTKKRLRTALRFFGVCLPLGDPKPVENSIYFSYETHLTANGERLPLSRVVYRSTFYTGESRLSEAQSRLLLQSDFGEQAATTLRGSRIERAQIELRGNACVGTFSLVENIAVEQEILVEEQSDYASSASSGSGTYSNRSPG